MPAACHRCGEPMQPGWITVQALGWIPEDEKETSTLRLHREVLAPAQALKTLRIPAVRCRKCEILILDYAPQGLVYHL